MCHTELCGFHHPQMQPTYAAPFSLSVETRGASPASGLVMEPTTAVTEQMNFLQPAVRHVTKIKKT